MVAISGMLWTEAGARAAAVEAGRAMRPFPPALEPVVTVLGRRGLSLRAAWHGAYQAAAAKPRRARR